MLIVAAPPSSAQKISYTDSVIASLKAYTEIERIDTLISLAHFPVEESSKASECIIFAQEAKMLALEQGILGKYTKALELEGVALGTLGKKVEGIDSIKKSLATGERLKNDSLIADGYLSLGNLHLANDELPDAIFSYKKSLLLFNQLKNPIGRDLAINNLANAHYHSGNYDEALAYYLQAEEIYKKNNDPERLAKNYSDLSLLYKALENYPKALNYVVKAIGIQKEEDQKFDLSISYLSAGNIQRRLKNFDSAFYYNREALNISIMLKDTIGIAFAQYNIASVHYSKNELDQAITNYLKSVKIFQNQHYVSKSIACYNSLSICYRKSGEGDKALAFANKAHDLAKQINSIPLFEMVYETLYFTYLDLDEYKLALKFRNLQIAYKDSLIDEQKIKELAKIETNYKLKSRDTEIDLLNKNKEIAAIKMQESEQMKYFLLVIAVLLLFMIGFVYNRYLAQKKIKLELAKANAQLKELNISKNKFFAIIAHDLRNPIAAFNNLSNALIDNFKQLSEEQLLNYLSNLKKSSDQFSGLLENLLQWAISQTDTLNIDIKEFDLSNVIQNNIDLFAQNAQQKNISLSFDKPTEAIAYADPSSIDVVFRNIISNAIKFSKNGSKIQINTSLTVQNVEISIRDEGIGMTAQEIEMLFDITKDTAEIGISTEKGSGLGLLLSHEYIKKSNGEIYVSSKMNEGSTFVIKLPRAQYKAA